MCGHYRFSFLCGQAFYNRGSTPQGLLLMKFRIVYLKQSKCMGNLGLLMFLANCVLPKQRYIKHVDSQNVYVQNLLITKDIY